MKDDYWLSEANRETIRRFEIEVREDCQWVPYCWPEGHGPLSGHVWTERNYRRALAQFRRVDLGFGCRLIRIGEDGERRVVPPAQVEVLPSDPEKLVWLSATYSDHPCSDGMAAICVTTTTSEMVVRFEREHCCVERWERRWPYGWNGRELSGVEIGKIRRALARQGNREEPGADQEHDDEAG